MTYLDSVVLIVSMYTVYSIYFFTASMWRVTLGFKNATSGDKISDCLSSISTDTQFPLHNYKQNTSAVDITIDTRSTLQSGGVKKIMTRMLLKYKLSGVTCDVKAISGTGYEGDCIDQMNWLLVSLGK